MILNPQNTNLNTVGAGTLLAALLLGGFVARGGSQSGGFTDTTDTATAIAAAMGTGANTPSNFTLDYVNTTGQTATLAGGTGVTPTAGTEYSTFTVAAGVCARILFTWTSPTALAFTILQKFTLA